MAEMEGPGVIQHIWMTVTDRTEKDYYVLRDLVLRIYWDDEEEPSVESPLGDFFLLWVCKRMSGKFAPDRGESFQRLQ